MRACPCPSSPLHRQKNGFKTTLFLHHLLTYAHETGAVDNTAYRDFSGLDTLQASNVLRRLRDRGILEKARGRKPDALHTEPSSERPDAHPEQGKLPLEDGKQTAEGGKQALEGGKRNLPPLPTSLASRLPNPVKSEDPHPYPLPQAGE